VLGRTGVLRGSSGCLNTGSWCFLLVGARETRGLVLPSSGFYRKQRVGALSKLQLAKKEVVASQ
jgi:hypothetical protein